MIITVITPTLRAERMGIVAASVRRAAEVVPQHTVCHVFAHWCAEPDHSRTHVAAWLTSLMRAVEGWLVFCDDDNLLHPSVLAALSTTVATHPEATVIVFGQARPDMGGYLPPTVPPTPGRIDGGQVALWQPHAITVPWRGGAMGDGEYLADLYAQTNGAGWVTVDAALTYHNAQEWSP